MQKAQKLSSYEQRQYARLVRMWTNLILGGMQHEQATERIIRDLKIGGSEISPDFVRRALNQ